MNLKLIILFLFSITTSTSIAQKSRINILLGHNTAFKSSILNTTPNTIYTYNKNDKGNNNFVGIPNYNIGINYERIINSNLSFFTGLHTARTVSELIFQDFNNPVDDGSFVKYGYGVNTYEIPIGICYKLNMLNKFILKNYVGVTINLNGLSSGSIFYRLKQSSASDTTNLRWTEIKGFPSGNSLGIRYGIGISPFKKISNWELGVYLNLQFRRSLTWDQEVEFENISQNTYEYHHATLKDKPDYITFHLKYTFLKF